MHQPVVEPMFRRGSFGVEPSLKDVPPSSDAAQQLTELLNRPDRPIPSRRSSMRAGTTTFVPPPPPPPPIVDPIRVASQTTPMRPPSPIDMPRSSSNIRKAQRSPVRPPPLLSSPPRRNSSQAEHFMRSSISPPPSASKRAYSFAREQTFRPSVIGQPRPPTRTNSCPPDADIFKTRMMRSNSDGYTSASTSFVTEGSSSPTSSDSSQPSDNEEGLHIKVKANYASFDPAQLEMESRRLELVWRETEKQWKDKHGITLPRSQDMAFRRDVEAGHGQKDDGPQEQEWREMWKNTNSSWAEFEVRWRKEESQRRARDDDNHFHTAHAESRGAPIADDDKVMSTILSHFEKEMEKHRQRAERKRQEEAERKRQEEAERKRQEHERPAWQATAERESESRRSSSQGTAKEHATDKPHDNWLHDKLLRPDMMRTRSSTVVVEGRPVFQRSRSGSVATIVDPLVTDTVISPPPFNPVSQPDERHPRVKRNRSSRGSRESFESATGEEEAREKHRAEGLKRHYVEAARQHYNVSTADSTWGPSTRPDKSHAPRREHHTVDELRGELPRVKEESPRDMPSTPHPDSRPSSLSKSPSAQNIQQATQPGVNTSLQEEVLRLEREQALLARRIQELRAAAEAAAAEGAKPPPTEPENERGREKDKSKDKERDQKPKGEPRAKSQGTRKNQEAAEADVFKAMQERLRKVEEHRSPTADFTRKAKRAASVSGIDLEPPSATADVRQSIPTPIDRYPIAAPVDTEATGGRVHFASFKPSVEDLPSPTPPRVRTPGPRVATPARVRTPSPRSQSPAVLNSGASIASSNATRDTSSVHEATSSIHEAVAKEPLPNIVTSAAQPPPRPVLRPRDTNHVPERPKSGSTPTLAVPHVSISPSLVESTHDQDASPMNAKTPRASTFDPDRTPRAQAGPVPEPNVEAPRVYVSPNQARARAEGVRIEEETTKRRVDVALGATVAAAAAETFDRAGGKKRTKEAELRAQEERRATEEQLAREQRRAEDERRQREEQRAEETRRREEQRAEEARRREAAEKREREERARYEREKRERERQDEERRRRWAAEGSRAPRQPSRSDNVVDAWNSYELRWSALSVASSTQPITFRDIPWPLLRIPTGPESITPQAVGAFLLSPLHSQDKSRKERLRSAMLRWHSDKFEGRWMARIDEEEQPKVKEAVGAVARALTELMTKPDLY